MAILLSRNEFREAVLERDGACVWCYGPAEDAHHLIERRLWDDGGYYLENGASLCGSCHLLAEATLLPVDQLREAAGIDKVMLPDSLEDDHEYDKWGNIILPDGKRMRGPLFYDESVQKALEPVLSRFVTYVKYPRTPHLPWSKGGTPDDMKLREVHFLPEEEVVIMEKLDGENTTMYRDYIHARSLDSGYHPSRNWVKNFWSTNVAYQIPENMRICGENMFAQHSIKYTDLETYFYGFSIWEDDFCLDYDETIENFDILGITPARLFARGKFSEMTDFFSYWNDGSDTEGYIVRSAGSFPLSKFQRHVAKYVRPDHVAGRTHWLAGKLDKNELA